MKFRCAGVSDSMIDGIGIALDVYFQGCNLGCLGCHNPELQAFDGGFLYDTDEVMDILECHLDFYDSVCLTGGDPIDQVVSLYDIVSRSDLPTVLYTGRAYNMIPEHIRECVSVIVADPYIEALKTGKFPGSSNQTIWGAPEIVAEFMKNKVVA
jgi:anaerobic ribonucleoside-triphosphate reductase activating protein